MLIVKLVFRLFVFAMMCWIVVFSFTLREEVERVRVACPVNYVQRPVSGVEIDWSSAREVSSVEFSRERGL